MDVTTLTALVIAVRRDDREGYPPDGPWATAPPYRQRGQRVRSIVAGLLRASVARVVRRRREASAPLAPLSTN